MRRESADTLDEEGPVELRDRPDLLFVARSRRELIRARGVLGAPDLIVEILSRSTARRGAGA